MVSRDRREDQGCADARRRPPPASGDRLSRLPLLAILFLSLVIAALWHSLTAVNAQSATEETTPVAVRLHPGWNFVGWLMADGPVDLLYAQVDETDMLYVQHPSQREKHELDWRRIERGTERVIQTGEALWIKLRGDESVAWWQAALRDPPATPIPAGTSAVVKTWRHYRQLSMVTKDIREQLSHAYLWNARDQTFELYSSRFSSINPGHVYVSRGEALMVHTTAPALWGPPTEPVLTGLDWMPDTDRAELESLVTELYDYFERWFGKAPSGFSVRVKKFGIHCLTGGSNNRLDLYLPCADLRRFAGTYVGAGYADYLFGHLQQNLETHEPAWLQYAHAHYVHRRWLDEADIQSLDISKREMIGFARSTDLPLEDSILSEAGRSQQAQLWEQSRQNLFRSLSTLAVDWLVEHTSIDALAQYGQQRLSSPWRVAFEQAFGITYDTMLAKFAQYRSLILDLHGPPPSVRSRTASHCLFWAHH